jgi:hypothetical protein
MEDTVDDTDQALTPSPEDPCVRVSVHVDAGPEPEGVATQRIDEALAHSDAAPGTHVSVAVPAGNAEMVEHLHDVLDEERTRRAGATVIVDGVLRPEG